LYSTSVAVIWIDDISNIGISDIEIFSEFN